MPIVKLTSHRLRDFSKIVPPKILKKNLPPPKQALTKRCLPTRVFFSQTNHNQQHGAGLGDAPGWHNTPQGLDTLPSAVPQAAEKPSGHQAGLQLDTEDESNWVPSSLEPLKSHIGPALLIELPNQ